MARLLLGALLLSLSLEVSLQNPVVVPHEDSVAAGEGSSGPERNQTSADFSDYAPPLREGAEFVGDDEEVPVDPSCPLNIYFHEPIDEYPDFVCDFYVLSLVRDVNDTYLIASPMNHFGDLDFSNSSIELTNCTKYLDDHLVLFAERDIDSEAPYLDLSTIWLMEASEEYNESLQNFLDQCPNRAAESRSSGRPYPPASKYPAKSLRSPSSASRPYRRPSNRGYSKNRKTLRPRLAYPHHALRRLPYRAPNAKGSYPGSSSSAYRKGGAYATSHLARQSAAAYGGYGRIAKSHAQSGAYGSHYSAGSQKPPYTSVHSAGSTYGHSADYSGAGYHAPQPGYSLGASHSYSGSSGHGYSGGSGHGHYGGASHGQYGGSHSSAYSAGNAHATGHGSGAYKGPSAADYHGHGAGYRKPASSNYHGGYSGGGAYGGHGAASGSYGGHGSATGAYSGHRAALSGYGGHGYGKSPSAYGGSGAAPTYGGSSAAPAHGEYSAAPGAYGESGGASASYGGSGGAPAYGGSGAAPAYGGSGAAPAYGGSGAATSYVGSGGASGYSGSGAGSAYGGSGAASGYGGSGSAPAYGGSGGAPAYGGPGAAPAYGGSGSASGYSGSGAAPGYGGSGAASGYGGSGAASGYGGSGAASGYGGSGAASGYGGSGAASGYGGSGAASGYGGSGGVPAYGGSGGAPGYGGSGSAPAYAGSGGVPAYGGPGSASTYGGSGAASGYGGSGGTSAYGGSGAAPAYNAKPQGYGGSGAAPAYGGSGAAPAYSGSGAAYGGSGAAYGGPAAEGAYDGSGSGDGAYDGAGKPAGEYGGAAPGYGGYGAAPGIYGAGDPTTYPNPSSYAAPNPGAPYGAQYQPSRGPYVQPAYQKPEPGKYTQTRLRSYGPYQRGPPPAYGGPRPSYPVPGPGYGYGGQGIGYGNAPYGQPRPLFVIRQDVYEEDTEEKNQLGETLSKMTPAALMKLWPHVRHMISANNTDSMNDAMDNLYSEATNFIQRQPGLSDGQRSNLALAAVDLRRALYSGSPDDVMGRMSSISSTLREANQQNQGSAAGGSQEPTPHLGNIIVDLMMAMLRRPAHVKHSLNLIRGALNGQTPPNYNPQAAAAPAQPQPALNYDTGTEAQQYATPAPVDETATVYPDSSTEVVTDYPGTTIDPAAYQQSGSVPAPDQNDDSYAFVPSNVAEMSGVPANAEVGQYQAVARSA